MDDAIRNEQAKKIFDTICAMMDSHELKYSTDEERLAVFCTITGEDLPVELNYFVRKTPQVVTLFSPLPFSVPEDQRMAVATALTVVNDSLIFGAFDFNLNSGKIVFRASVPYMDTELAQEIFFYMLIVANRTTDEYNDKLMMLGKGMYSLADFLKGEEKE